jgi:hypothetical protein
MMTSVKLAWLMLEATDWGQWQPNVRIENPSCR